MISIQDAIKKPPTAELLAQTAAIPFQKKSAEKVAEVAEATEA